MLMVYWAVKAVGAKKSIGARVRWRNSGVRVGVLVLVVLALHLTGVRQAFRHARADADSTGMLLGLIGVVLCALGVGLAIWARAFLGRNWGMPMSRKQDPELVTGGPYAYVRHPIYTGIMLAMLGSALGESVFWVLPLLLFGGYFIHSARAEEKLMLEQFPEQYPAYRRRTKMLLPFLF